VIGPVYGIALPNPKSSPNPCCYCLGLEWKFFNSSSKFKIICFLLFESMSSIFDTCNVSKFSPKSKAYSSAC